MANSIQRVKILQRLDELSANHCKACDKKIDNSPEQACSGCEIYKEFRQLGDKLNGLAGSNKKAHAILAKGQDMTWSEVDWLLETDFTREQIREAMGLSYKVFNEIEQARREGTEMTSSQRVRNEKPTREDIIQLRSEGKKDSEIMKLYGMNNGSYYPLKKSLFTPEELSEMRGKPFVSRTKKEKVSVSAEIEKNAPEQPPILADEVKEQLATLVEQLEAENKRLSDEKYELEKQNLDQVAKLNALVANNQDLQRELDRSTRNFIALKEEHEQAIAVEVDQRLLQEVELLKGLVKIYI